MHKSSATRRALLYCKRRRSPARCAGTGTATSKATTGSENLSVGLECLAESTRLQRTGLIESVLPENGEKPLAVLTRKVIKAEMKARMLSQADNQLSALRG
jgi:hypothetical protein